MPADIREYLAQRFRSDAETLRARAASLQGAAKPAAGPDAALSLAMAQACEEVSALAEALPEFAPLPDMLAALRALLPELNRRADAPALANKPAVRSVYAGAATRVQEVITAEERASSEGGVPEAFDDMDDNESDTFDDIDDDLLDNMTDGEDEL